MSVLIQYALVFVYLSLTTRIGTGNLSGKCNNKIKNQKVYKKIVYIL